MNNVRPAVVTNQTTVDCVGNKHLMPLPLAYVQIEHVIQTEEHDAVAALRLSREIALLQRWTTPILLLSHLPVLLDGHHRLAAARQLELVLIPAWLVSRDDQRLSLKAWRSEDNVTMDDLLAHVGAGTLFPVKTTRFTFSDKLPETSITLKALKTLPDYPVGGDRTGAI